MEINIAGATQGVVPVPGEQAHYRIINRDAVFELREKEELRAILAKMMVIFQ